jgi:3-oxoacyl-[acyl-carrier-protein] synthase III
VPERVFIIGTGEFLPGEPVPFEQIDEVLGELTLAPAAVRRFVESTRPVMQELLDIRQVHFAIDPKTKEFTEDNVTMAVKAARLALGAAGVEPAEVELICYGSAHQDQMPTASVRIQEALGIKACAELGIHANCTSAYKALYLAHQLLRAGQHRTALVVSAGISSSELRASYLNQALIDRESIFLRWFLSDGAGALVLSADPARAHGLEVEHTYIESVGGEKPSMMFNGRPALYLNPKEEYERGLHHLRQSFRNALSSGVFQEEGGSVFFKGLKRMLERAGIRPESIKVFQVNLPAKHIVGSIMDECRTIGIPASALFTRLDQEGYCGPPMPFICLNRIVAEGKLLPGDRVVSFVTEVSKFMQAGYSVVRVP